MVGYFLTSKPIDVMAFSIVSDGTGAASFHSTLPEDRSMVISVIPSIASRALVTALTQCWQDIPVTVIAGILESLCNCLKRIELTRSQA